MGSNMNQPESLEKILTGRGFHLVTEADTSFQPHEMILPGGGCPTDLQERSAMRIEPKPQRDHSSAVPQQQVDYDVASIIESILWQVNFISEKVIGREEVITQAIYAILTGEHMMLLSRTGMAKSYLARHIFGIFEGARVFSSQASKDQTPDNYFGPYNIEEFKKGFIRHNIKGSIIEANLVFLDEFFDASDVVLRSLLSVLNERKFINGSEQVDAAVHTAIATANYLRMNEVTEAVLDRFTYKSIIPEDSNTYSQLLIDHSYNEFSSRGYEPALRERKVYFNQMLYLNNIIKNRNEKTRIEVPDIILYMKNVVVNSFVNEMRKWEENYYISPRKQAKLTDFLRASALLDGRFEATMDDVRHMYLALCTLNSYVSVKNTDKSEKDIFMDIFENTMKRYQGTGAMEQVRFLLQVREIFTTIRNHPGMRGELLKKQSLLDTLLGLFSVILPSKKKEGKEVTVESLKQDLLDLHPALEEVDELKKGIMLEFKDLA